MTSSLAELMSGSSGLAFPALMDSAHLLDYAMIQPGMIVAQVMKWLPSWLTPLWIIAVGLGIGVLVSLAVYLLLAVLSFVPGIGNLPDSPRRGVVASLSLGGVIAAGLCYLYVPQEDKYAETLFLPLICIGLVLGFGLIYGAWHRTRNEWSDMLTEGVVPYLLSVAGIMALIGFASTPLVSKPMDIIHSIPAVNFVGDGTVRVPGEVAPLGEETQFHPSQHSVQPS